MSVSIDLGTMNKINIIKSTINKIYIVCAMQANHSDVPSDWCSR